MEKWGLQALEMFKAPQLGVCRGGRWSQEPGGPKRVLPTTSLLHMQAGWRAGRALVSPSVLGRQVPNWGVTDGACVNLPWTTALGGDTQLHEAGLRTFRKHVFFSPGLGIGGHEGNFQTHYFWTGRIPAAHNASCNNQDIPAEGTIHQQSERWPSIKEDWKA